MSLFPGQYIPIANSYQQIVGLVAATTLTVPTGALYALVQAQSVDVRWRDDGVAPTATVGTLLAANAPPQGFVGNLAALQFIQTSAGTSTLNVSYYK